MLRFCIELIERLLLGFKLFDAVGDQFLHPVKKTFSDVQKLQNRLLVELVVEQVAALDNIFF